MFLNPAMLIHGVVGGASLASSGSDQTASPMTARRRIAS